MQESAGTVEIIERPLPYVQHLAQRDAADVRRIVLHCTELPDLEMAREFGERVHYQDGTGNSGHYYIDRDGRIECWVPDLRVAHHVRGYNADSIGIELVNAGRWPDWYHSRRQQPLEAYTDVQIDAVVALILALQQRLPAITGLVGHEDLDTDEVIACDDPGQTVRRKIDPGPLFPWLRVLHATALPRLRQ